MALMDSVRPNVRQMQPYSPGKPIEEVQRELGLSEVVKLASNENPLGPSPKAVAAVEATARKMHLYPDAAAHDLNAAIAAKLEVPRNQVILGNGSDEIIHLLGLVLIHSPEDEIVVGDPSFVRYDAAAHLAPCRLVKVALDGDERHDLSAMARAVTEHTRIVFIANPNNPTGTIVRKPEVDAFLNDLPAHVLTVLDEAYFEFAAHLSDYPSAANYVREGRNVFGMRTFSKAYGLAGLRLGYGFGPAEIVDGMHRAREPFNVNLLAQAAGVAALDDEEHLRLTVENNAAGLARLSDALRRVGAKPCESFANFVFADLGRPARPVFQALLERGIIVRSGDVLGKPNCLRVSVGTEEEMDRFVEALESVMREAAAR